MYRMTEEEERTIDKILEKFDSVSSVSLSLSDLEFLPQKIEKDWGYEIIRVNNKLEDYCSKILYIEKDKSTSMHYHVNKHESFYVRKGTLCVNLIDTSTTDTNIVILEEGDCMEIPRCQPHQLSSVEGAVEFDETSTYSSDSDSLRIWR